MKMKKNMLNKDIDQMAVDNKDPLNKKSVQSALIEYDKDVLDYILGGCEPILPEHTV